MFKSEQISFIIPTYLIPCYFVFEIPERHFMIDPKYFRIRALLEELARKLKKRGLDIDISKIESLEEERKQLQVETQNLQNERNLRSKEVGLAKAQGKDIAKVTAEMRLVGDKLALKQAELEAVMCRINEIYFATPNIPHESVPDGMGEENNLEVRRWGEPTKLNFKPKEHQELGEQLGMMDFAAAAKISGSRFVVLKDKLAELHRILIKFMIDVHTREHGYQEVYVPYLVNQDSLFGTGQLPKFANDLFHLNGEHNYSLIPTAEVPVTNLVRDEIIDAAKMPLKYVCHTPCFRSESGSYGKDTKGMFRHHQFEKVEIVRMERPENSYLALEELTGHAEKILQKLEIPYRVVSLCGGDLGFSSAKTYDIEVWLPGQNCYREISSCSNFEDFQARRMQARWRNPETGKPELLHTLNGSGLAVGRTLIAIMENYQDEKGRIHIPKVLHEYMGGLDVIG